MKLDLSDATKFGSLTDVAAAKAAVQVSFHHDGNDYNLTLTLTGTDKSNLTVSQSDLTTAITNAITANSLTAMPMPGGGTPPPNNVYTLAADALGTHAAGMYAILPDGSDFKLVAVEDDGYGLIQPVSGGVDVTGITQTEVDAFMGDIANVAMFLYEPPTPLPASAVTDIKVEVSGYFEQVPLQVAAAATPTDGLTIQMNGDLSFNAASTIKVFAQTAGVDTELSLTLVADSMNKGVFYVSASDLAAAYTAASIAEKDLPPEALVCLLYTSPSPRD